MGLGPRSLDPSYHKLLYLSAGDKCEFAQCVSVCTLLRNLYVSSGFFCFVVLISRRKLSDISKDNLV